MANLITTFILLQLLIPNANSVYFEFTTFEPNTTADLISFQGDAFSSNGVLHLTKTQPLSIGRASYAKPVPLWDANTGRITDFAAHFSFIISSTNKTGGDGISFFISPFNSDIPRDSSGGYLGLFSPEQAKDSSSTNPVVAVEFDSFQNTWDPSSDHMGININSIVSETTCPLYGSINDGRVAKASVSYNSTSGVLSVFLAYNNDPNSSEEEALSLSVNLKSVSLPESVRVGFSAATSDLSYEIHNILSWSFNSTLESTISLGAPSSSPISKPSNSNLGPEGQTLNLGAPHEGPSFGTSSNKSLEASSNPSRQINYANNAKRKSKLSLEIGLASSFGVLLCGLGLLSWFIFKKKGSNREKELLDEEEECDVISIDDEFEKGAGPKRFTYRELSRATNNFSEGGFGGVYKGLLSIDQSNNVEVAVKRVSRGLSQGKKEYISEVKTISRLRHRNLAKLIGWCHERGEFLLVYEFMTKGSLDSHIFNGKVLLPWSVRYKIALGLASAILYLHDEWEECVIHRDIKASNVMLDLDFNAKLGDFGLATFADHKLGLPTTVLAGTMGYLAPECVTTRKASKETDIYSFGVVALEICCGRRPIVSNKEEPSSISLVESVWELYGKGQLFETVDKGLCVEFDEQEAKCLMIVGLWCCHPDPTSRPCIKQVMNVLTFEVALPNVPSKLPLPMYCSPDEHQAFMTRSISCASSGRATGSFTTTDSSTFAGPSKRQLK